MQKIQESQLAPNISVENGDLFKVDEKYYLAHCISSDCALGAGIAVQFEKKFHLRKKLQSLGAGALKYPVCIRIGRIFNLITKEKYYHKPTLQSLRTSVEYMRDMAIEKEINYIAMPAIGCGLDKLQWKDVSQVLIDVFQDTDINVLVYFL